MYVSSFPDTFVWVFFSLERMRSLTLDQFPAEVPSVEAALDLQEYFRFLQWSPMHPMLSIMLVFHTIY
jgi:hypothetical protein